MQAKQSETVLRLKGNVFADPEYFRTDVTKGVTRTPSGTRICSLPSDFLLGLRDALIYECGRSYRGVMKASGKRWGVQFIKRLDREMTGQYQSQFKELPRGLQRTIIADAFNYHGYGKLSVETDETNTDLLIAEVRNPMLPNLVREADRPVDLMMAGLLASIFSHLTGKSQECIQTECVTLGHECSKFIIGPIGKLGEVEEWLENADTMPSHEDILAKLNPKPAAAPVVEQATEADSDAEADNEPEPTEETEASVEHEAAVTA